LSPLSWGLIIAFALFFVIVVIVRSVTGANAQTQTLPPSLNAPLLQNSVGDALPAFSLQGETAALPTPVVMQQLNMGDIRPRLTQTMGVVGRMVWVDGWYNCQWITPSGDYLTPSLRPQGAFTDPGWAMLSALDRRDITEVCNGQ